MEIDGAARNGVDSIRVALDNLAKGKNIKISVTRDQYAYGLINGDS